VRHNTRPPIAAHTLPPATLDLTGHPFLLCPERCGRWLYLHRSMLPAHRATDGITRCTGSGQRIRIDLTPAEHAARLAAAQHTADYRRSAQIHRVAKPPVPVALCRMNRTAA
jgi:hypothetical protein